MDVPKEFIFIETPMSRADQCAMLVGRLIMAWGDFETWLKRDLQHLLAARGRERDRQRTIDPSLNRYDQTIKPKPDQRLKQWRKEILYLCDPNGPLPTCVDKNLQTVRNVMQMRHFLAHGQVSVTIDSRQIYERNLDPSTLPPIIETYNEQAFQKKLMDYDKRWQKGDCYIGDSLLTRWTFEDVQTAVDKLNVCQIEMEKISQSVPNLKHQARPIWSKSSR